MYSQESGLSSSFLICGSYEKNNAAAQTAHVPVQQGWGLKIDIHEKTYEAERMSFSSQGAVKIADGREINFNLNFRVSHIFMERHSINKQRYSSTYQFPCPNPYWDWQALYHYYLLRKRLIVRTKTHPDSLDLSSTIDLRHT